MHSGMESPEGTWWLPAHRTEKVWVAIAFVWCMILFAMMPIMHARGGQNVSGIRHTVKPTDYARRYGEFVKQYQVGSEAGYPVAAPPQVAADLLNGPGREPAEGEYLIEWMKANEEGWRRD